MSYIVVILITAPVAYVAGFLTHWSFGSNLRAKAQALETRVRDAVKK